MYHNHCIMMQIELDNILDTVKKLNPWFKTAEVPSKFLKPYVREELSILKDTMQNNELATLLIGGRRVGKSVLMYQLIDSLIRSGVDPKKILFVQGDNTILRENILDKNILSAVIKTYEKYILDDDLSSVEDTVYIFLDEAQALPNWDAEVKNHIDLKYPIKFLISGSSSTKLRQGIQNPLVGRVHVTILSPFSFRDFIGYESSTNALDIPLREIDELRDEFHELLKAPNMIKIQEIVNNLTHVKNSSALVNLFKDYALYGGFPYVVENKDKEDVNKYLRDILQMTFSKDVLQEEQIREPLAFERLMVNICMNISGVFKLNSLAEKIGLKDERTVRRYIDYYVDSHYAFVSLPFSFTNKQETIKSNKKIYSIDSGVVNTLLFKNQKDLEKDTAYMGVIAENIVHNALLRFKQCASGNIYDSIPHWNNTKTHREIDFVFETDGQIYPVEVKNKDTIREEELLELDSFLTRKELSGVGFVVTSSLFEKRGTNMLLVPTPIFSLLL
ncbi:MAG: hypothetical protein UV21_C0005G0089 [candidate division WWE3 bacterium GW2011_GWD2_42_34]|nr:MAG: hypothetical protein UV21_C0005G0089 [candidate division WWE3 bacterium GW2011_GWD2_42_34]KKT08404.1 MAG: hypothetical protein UV87_C0004G0094 [candidate division WWE3 bacterium GW2011_GWD1_43_201]KKT10427.1 MAG: hypothetical protein UV90_C0005G0074 [candidate division WWE3 bacterium GW2011_GWA2_43_24]